MEYGVDAQVRVRLIAVSVGLVAVLVLVFLIALGSASARASEGGCPTGGLVAHKHKRISAQTVTTVDCFVGAEQQAIKNDDNQIAQGVQSCLNQQALPPAGQDWVPVEKTGMNLLDAVTVNREGEQELLAALAGGLQSFEANYNPLGQGRLDLRKAIRDVSQYLASDLDTAETEATTAANELTSHACMAASTHRLTKSLAGIARERASIKQNLDAALKEH